MPTGGSGRSWLHQSAAAQRSAGHDACRGPCRSVSRSPPTGRSANVRHRLFGAQRRQADARRPYPFHRDRRRALSAAAVSRRPRGERQPSRRLGHPVRDGDLRLQAFPAPGRICRQSRGGTVATVPLGAFVDRLSRIGGGTAHAETNRGRPLRRGSAVGGSTAGQRQGGSEEAGRGRSEGASSGRGSRESADRSL